MVVTVLWQAGARVKHARHPQHLGTVQTIIEQGQAGVCNAPVIHRAQVRWDSGVTSVEKLVHLILFP